MLSGFKDFAMRGNVVELAVGFVMGVAFSAVISGVVEGVITPLIAAIFGEPDLTGVGVFTLNGATFSLGLVIDALVNFLLVAAAVYFVVVAPINALSNRNKKEEAEKPAGPTDTELLTEIRDLLAKR